jgi:hypothetical protein
MVVAQHRCIPLERRAQPHRIAIAQADRFDAPVAVEQAVGGVEILQGVIAIAGTGALENRVHPAHTRHLQRQLTARIAADALAPAIEINAQQALISLPELRDRLPVPQLLPGLADGFRPATAFPDTLPTQGLQEREPGLTTTQSRGDNLLLLLHRSAAACA